MSGAFEVASAKQDVRAKIDYVLGDGELSESECLDLCTRMRTMLQEEANCVSVTCPVVMVGDLHGQFQDFKELLRITGPPPDTNFLFLGDYVDRGDASVPTVSLCWLYKLCYPNRVHLLRGNHEARQITQVYGFFDECMKRYGSAQVWRAFTDTFDYLPLAAKVEDKAFCCHAGLSPSINLVDEIQMLDRFQEPPHEGPMCDLLWSDPLDCDGWAVSRRGAGYMWGQDVSERFNHENGVSVIVRAHQCVMEGYEWAHERSVLTVFSAPNYAYRTGNQGAVLDLDERGLYTLQQFDAAPEQREPRHRVWSPFPDYFSVGMDGSAASASRSQSSTALRTHQGSATASELPILAAL